MSSPVKNKKTITKREKAMKYWHKLTDADKEKLAMDNYKRPYQTLTGREIEVLYKNHIRRINTYVYLLLSVVLPAILVFLIHKKGGELHWAIGVLLKAILFVLIIILINRINHRVFAF